MQDIKQIIFSITIKVFGIYALAFLIALVGAISISHYTLWKTESYAFERLDTLSICNAVKVDCENKVDEELKQYPFSSIDNKVTAYLVCMKKHVNYIYCEQPQTFSSRMGQVAWEEIFLVAFIIPFALFYAIKFFLYINHVGWRRITMLSSLVVASYFIYESHNNFYNAEEYYALSMVAFFVMLALPYISLQTYKWVREGFTDKEEARAFIRKYLLDSVDVKHYEIDKKFMIRLGKLFLITFLVLIVLIFRPERTITIFIKSFFVVLFVSGVIYFIHKWKDKNNKY